MWWGGHCFFPVFTRVLPSPFNVKTTIARGYPGKLSSCSIGETNDKLHSFTESSETAVCLTTNSAVLLVGITLLAKHVGFNHLLPPTSFRRGVEKVSLPR